MNSVIENTVSLDTTIIAIMIDKLKIKLVEEKITIETINLVLKEAMQIVDKTDLPGSQKREHVLTIVRAVVKDLVENEFDERLILELIDKKVLGNTIDLIIEASKGNLDINNKDTQKKIKSCTSTFIPILINGIIRIFSLVKSKKQKISKPKSTTMTKIVKENSQDKITEIELEIS